MGTPDRRRSRRVLVAVLASCVLVSLGVPTAVGRAAAGTTISGATVASSHATWSELQPRDIPSNRLLSVMAEDPTGGLVLFGGAPQTLVSQPMSALRDTWRYRSGAWTQLSPGLSPPARRDAVMAYDPVHQLTLLFGGAAADGTPLSDTWTWDGTSWTQVTSAPQPTARFAAGMAFDETRGDIVLFAGTTGNTTPDFLADTWVFDGTGWAPITTVGDAPSPRRDLAMASAVGGGVLVFGGVTDVWRLGSTFSDQTWVLDGDRWTQLSPTRTPPARYAARMALDQIHGVDVLVGGWGSFDADTWTWDGTTWTEQNPASYPCYICTSSPGSGGTAWPAVAAEPGTGRTLLFGGWDQTFLTMGTWTFVPNSSDVSSAPLVGPTSVQETGPHSATLLVHVDPNGLPTTTVVLYSSDGSSWSQAMAPSGTGGPVTLDGLLVATRYLVHVEASSGGGTTSGGATAFTTAGQRLPPAIRLQRYVSHGTWVSVVVSLDTRGQTADLVADYGPTAAYGTTRVLVDETAGGRVAAPLPGLRPGRRYHLRLSSTNEIGTTFSPDIVVTTDVTAPTAHIRRLPRGTTARTVRVHLAGSDDLAGVSGYDVRYRRARPNLAGFGRRVRISPPTGTTETAISSPPLTVGSTYCFSVRAHDRAGNTGAWSPEKCTGRAIDDRDLFESRGWSRMHGRIFYQGSALSSARRGTTLSTRVTLRRVGVLASTCPACGRLTVSVNGERVGTLDLRSRARHDRRILWLPAFHLRSGLVRLTVATSGRRVLVDGIFTSLAR